MIMNETFHTYLKGQVAIGFWIFHEKFKTKKSFSVYLNNADTRATTFCNIPNDVIFRYKLTVDNCRAEESCDRSAVRQEGAYHLDDILNLVQQHISENVKLFRNTLRVLF